MDRKFNILGMASTSLPNVLKLLQARDSEPASGSVVFEGAIRYAPEKNLVTKDIVEVGNFIIFQNKNKESNWHTIMNTENDEGNCELYFRSEEASMDLMNEVVGPYKASKSYPISHYIEQFSFDSGFEIGINEIPQLERKLEWEGEMTATKRLLSVATQFDNAEISYSFEIKGMQLIKKYIDIYKKRGNDLNIDLRLNHEVNNIITTSNIENLITALYVSGGTLEGQEQPVTLKGFNYDDGRFYVGQKDGVIRDRESIKLWSRYLTADNLSPDAGHIFGYKTDYTSTDQRTLCSQGISYLKKMCEVERNYEVDISILPENVRSGDRINIIDEAGKLYLNSRILKLDHSYIDGSSKAVLGEFLIKQSGIDEKVQGLADQIKNIPKGDTFFPWVRYADDENGSGINSMPLNKKYMAIKYSMNNPVPSDDPNDYVGLWTLIQGEEGVPGQKGDNGVTYYTWIKYATNVSGEGMSDSPTNKSYMGLATNKTSAIESTNPLDYSWSLIKGTDGKDGAQGPVGPQGGTGIQGPPGIDGKPTYTWVKYADSPTTGMSDDPTNKKYIGFAYNKSTIIESTSYAEYAWSLVKGADGATGPAGESGVTTYTWYRYADTQTGGGISVNPTGKKFLGLAFNKTTSTGSNTPTDYTWSAMYDDKKLTEIEDKLNAMTLPIVSETAPSSPKEGQQWWQTDSGNNIVGYFVYKNKMWAEQTIQQSILNIVELNAVKITGSEITGTVLTGSSILNSFDANFNGANLVGISKLEGGTIRIDYNLKGTTQQGYVEMNPLSFAGAMLDASGTALNSFELSSSGVYLKNGEQTATLSATELYDTGWIPVPIQNGMNAQVYVRKKFGIISIDVWVNTPKFGNAAGNTFATLPPGFRFYKDFSQFIGNNSLTGTGILRIMANGELRMWSGNNPTASYASIIVYPNL